MQQYEFHDVQLWQDIMYVGLYFGNDPLISRGQSMYKALWVIKITLTAPTSKTVTLFSLWSCFVSHQAAKVHYPCGGGSCWGNTTRGL